MRFSSTVLSLAAFAAPSFAYWRMACPGRLVDERIDPIVDPGGVAGHVHTVAGGNGLDFSMTYNSTQASTCSSCPIKQDLSNYWTPKLYYMMKNGSFQDVPQAGDGQGTLGGMTVYYLQRGGPNNDNLTAYPAGFRMIAGTTTKRSPTNDFAGQAVSFVCLNYSSTSPYYNKLPDQPCPDGLRAQIFFPSCWDGVNLDSPDHMSHMAYPTKYSYDNGPCPASHPVHMVSVFYEIIYSTINFDWWTPAGAWQPFVFANGDPTGYGFHGDFLNGWDVPTLQNATNICTADSGQPYDCPVFNFFTDDECHSCVVAPKINEQIYGTLPSLPGCNDITWANGTTTPCNKTAPAIGPSASYSKNVTGWTYVGCGSDNGVNRTFTADQWWSNSVTVEGCMDYCKSRGHNYIGLEYSTQCFCGDSLPASRAPTPGVLGNCFSRCAGDSSEYCGGSSKLSIYYNNGTYTPVSGTNSNSVPKLPVCPSSNNTIYNATNSASFTVQCGVDHQNGDIGMTYVPANNITACMEACAFNTGCTYVALSGAACYMKTGSNLKAQSNGGVIGAALVSAASVSTSTSTSASQSAAAATSAAASSTATMCPGADGTVINNYTVRCVSDSSVGSYSSAQASTSYLDCMTACDAQSAQRCIGFVYVGQTNGKGSGTCWLKTNMGTITQGGGPNYIAAYKPKVVTVSSSSSAAGSASGSQTAGSQASPASSAAAAGSTSTAAPTCPGSNSTYYTSSSGSTFLIECGIDHQGGDMGNTQVSSFQQCIEACSNTTGCVDVSLSGVACYMKSSIGAPGYNGVQGARLISGTTSTTANSKVKAKFINAIQASNDDTSSSSDAEASSTSTTKNKTATKKTATKSKTATKKTATKSATKQTHTNKASSTIKTTTRQQASTTTPSPSSTVTTVACPHNNNTIWIEPESGYKFLLQCGVDHEGHELTHVKAKGFKSCITTCASTDSCVDVSFSAGVCYLKKALGDKKFSSKVNGAKLLSHRTTTLSVSSSTAEATQTASDASSAASTSEPTDEATTTKSITSVTTESAAPLTTLAPKHADD